MGGGATLGRVQALPDGCRTSRLARHREGVQALVRWAVIIVIVDNYYQSTEEQPYYYFYVHLILSDLDLKTHELFLMLCQYICFQYCLSSNLPNSTSCSHPSPEYLQPTFGFSRPLPTPTLPQLNKSLSLKKSRGKHYWELMSPCIQSEAFIPLSWHSDLVEYSTMQSIDPPA